MTAFKIIDPRIFQFKISLKNISPPIWRRFQVPTDYTLADLHATIQKLMDWENYHLHKFIVDNKTYCPLEPDWDMFGENIDESKIRLGEVLKTEKASFLYVYDFGDDWEHELVLEKILEPDPEAEYPLCLTGGRSGPPEDSGGPWGYQNYLDVLSDSSSENHEQAKEWIGHGFDPEHFSINEINERLHKL